MEEIRAGLPADVSFSNALEGVRLWRMDHICSLDGGIEMASVLKFRVLWPNAVSVHFSC